MEKEIKKLSKQKTQEILRAIVNKHQLMNSFLLGICFVGIMIFLILLVVNSETWFHGLTYAIATFMFLGFLFVFWKQDFYLKNVKLLLGNGEKKK